MEKLSDLVNVGKILEKKLYDIGISNKEQLIELGSREVFLRIKLIDSGACLSMLYGIEGAIQGVRGFELSKQTKDQLKEFFRKL